MKRIGLIFAVLITISYLYAAEKPVKNDESIIAYRNAIEAMDAQDYGTALKYCEDAILYRKQRIEKQITTLKNSLSAKRVQAAGDRFDPVLSVLDKRGEYETASIINYYLKKKSVEYFEDSITNLLDYLENSKDYPEAHKLIGDIYKLEGEYQFAEEYYMMALEHSDVLDIPDEKYEILYMLADISRLQGDKTKMEVRLLNILAEDVNYMSSPLRRAMLETIKGNKKGSMEKFFTLYRADSYRCIQAYNLLAEYYYAENKKDKALEFAALGAITGFSKIVEILYERNSSYEYSDLSTFMQEASFYDDIVQWGSVNYAWKSFNILARFSIEAGYKQFAEELLKVIAQFSPETYWQRDAVLILENINQY